MDDDKKITANADEAPVKRKRRTKAEMEAAASEAAATKGAKAKATKAKAAKVAADEQKPEKAVRKAASPKSATKDKAVAKAEAKPKVARVAKPKAEKAEEVVAEVAAEVAAPPVVVKAVKVKVEAEVKSEKVELVSLVDKSAEQLCDIFATEIQNLPIAQLRTRVEQIKEAFYRIVRAADEAARAEFVGAGGDAEQYKTEVSDTEKRFKELLTLYRDKRDKFLSMTEEQKEANYKAKLALIEELKALVGSTETLGQTFAAFRDLQSRWKEIGVVPLGVTKDLWETYHHHTENFYNFIKINKELRDIDLKRNYEAKLAICEEAEALMENPSATAAFNTLQKLHDLYREAGPVAAELKEQLWERFKAASTRVNKRHQDHYDSLREEQERNLALKSEICAKIEEFASLPLTSIKEWSSVQEQISELQKVWKTIGFAPKKDNNKIYERFRAACDKFFSAKRLFFGGLRSEMDDNLQVKLDLCVQAEAMSMSEDWKTATDTLIDLQKRWKASGQVARKHSDAVWKRFRAACDSFFQRKGEHFKESDSKFAENLEAKRAIISELQQMAQSDALSFDSLKEVMQRFSAIGFVPIKLKESIAKEYKQVVDQLFDILRSKEGSGRIERFKERVNMARGNSSNKFSSERDKLYSRVRALESEVKLLENNIGFFANSKNAKGLIADVEHKIEKTKGEMAELIQKIKIIDNGETL